MLVNLINFLQFLQKNKKILNLFLKKIINNIHRYYEGGVASVYVWDKSGKDYALGFLCKKGNYSTKYILIMYSCLY